METRTLPAHAVFDKAGAVVSVVLLNGRTPEFYQVERMAFDDIGGFLKEVITDKNEKETKRRTSNAGTSQVLESSKGGAKEDESHSPRALRSGSGD